ncbi:ectonucleoside triphosphate diphosphohydrolase 3 [Amia ocellicauda]|uniref:ectonucleoside triphosphate diphosphohydrolase 3 n=1 Tax=Amia ocellicauda TaxID=2972642 RepID=UPI00346415F8|nr:ENTP3 diphosphohydrolase [Amia calva]
MVSKLAAVIALFFLLASLAVIVAVAVIQVHKKHYLSPGLKYGIVLDAGSSRTTVYVYQWPAEKENNTGIVSQTMSCMVNGSGISSLTLNPRQDQVSWSSMQECMSRTQQTIPSSQHNITPVFLGATAGMRLLRSQNETAASKIMEKIESYLQSLPYDFQNASIISGEEEGLYGWVTANYLMGNFLEKNLWNTWVRPHGAETIGSLDLGGASTQIAFAPAPPETPSSPGEDFSPVRYNRVMLYGYAYEVYTHSYTCYGKNEAEKQVLATLAQRSTAYIENPCFPQDYESQIPAREIFGSLCTAAKRPANYNPKKLISFIGTGDPALCRAVVRSIFNFSSCEGKKECSFNGVYQPALTGNFVAYAGFYYTTDFLRLNGSFSLEKFNSTMWSFCSQKWKHLQAKYAKKESYLRGYCFSANYIYSLLVDGYKFNSQTWNNIQFRKEVNENSIAWSLGYMLTLSNMVPAEAKLVRLPLSSSVFAGLLFMFSALAILSLMFLIISVVRSC